MLESVLLSILIVAVLLQIAVSIKRNTSAQIASELKEVGSTIVKFETVLGRIETVIKDEFQRNRVEINDISQSNREELSRSINTLAEEINQKQDSFTEKTTQKFSDFGINLKNEAKDNRKELSEGLQSFENKFNTSIQYLNESLHQKFSDLNKQQLEQNKQSIETIKVVKDTVYSQLEDMRNNNEKHLTEIRKTVDEKLQNTLEKRLGETFKQVSDRLEQVHRGLGEMQTIATGVGDLKKVLSNVKTRGILGEYQLGSILEEILTPDQYGKNVATKKGSQAHVEYAIKLPGKESNEDVWLPVDSKFPIESYELLLQAYDEGFPQKIDTAQKMLVKSIEGFAKDISTKYIDPPNTTDFCIMFLPIESLYAEILRHPGLFEILQRKYKITITGPTTLSALLNSLQMGFRTLAVQKRSSEVWRILGAVKAEFGKFTEQLVKVQKQINTASGSLEMLRITRTNQIEKKLRDVQTLDTIVSNEILELPIEKSRQ